MKTRAIIAAILATASVSAARAQAGRRLPPAALRAHPRRARSRRERFTVGDIRIEGLQRVSEGTVFNYLPVNIGDELGPQRIREAIRALYATGLLPRRASCAATAATLVVAVKERPSIESFEIKGNKDIKTEELTKVLRNVGLAAGKTFDRSVLEGIQQELTEQYFSRGKYARAHRHDGRRPARQPRAHQGRHQGRFAREDPADQHRRQHEVQAEGHPRDARAEDPSLEHLVQAERPLFEGVAAGRPREGPLVLPGPRLRELPDRVRPGDHRARQGRHVHHGERARGRRLQGLRREDRRQHEGAGG